MSELWHRGVAVPYPVAYADDVFDLEYIGDWERAAPQLRAARLSAAEVRDAFDQLVVGIRAITAAGYAHGDLSAYNLLWWQGRLVFIDFPQAVDLAANLRGLDFLHRDVVNICGWFASRGLDADPEELFADALSFL